VAPDATSTPDVADGSDSGTSDTDNITSDTTPAFTGTGEAGNVITLTLANGTYKTTVQGNGTWTIDTGNVTAGVFVAGNANTYATFSSGAQLDLGLTSANAFTDNARSFNVGVTATDVAGNAASVTIPVRIDTIVTDPTINITNGISPVTGTGEAGAGVVLYESAALASSCGLATLHFSGAGFPPGRFNAQCASVPCGMSPFKATR
jgi:hypothetical protein